MKHQLKNYLKLGILLFGVSVFIIACQKEDDLSKQQEQNIGHEEISETLTTVKYSSGKHPLVSNFFKEKRSSNNKNATNDNYLELTFGVVDLNRGIGIVGESGSITFSFPVIVNEYDYQVFYNYLVKEDFNGNVSSVIRAYDMDANYATAYRNNEVDISTFTGTIKNYDTESLLKNGETFTESCPEDEVNNGNNNTGNTGGNSGDDTTDDDNGDPIGGEGDTGTPGDPDPQADQTEICNIERYIKNCGSGSPGSENFHKVANCGPSNGNGTLSANAEYLDAWECFIPERNNNPDVCDEDAVVVEDDDNPCEKLNALLSDPAFSSALSNIQQNADGDDERGYEISKDENGNISTNFVQGAFDRINLKAGENIIGGIHNHTDEYGHPMFSGEDIQTLLLYYFLNQNRPTGAVKPSDVSSIMVYPNGDSTITYAITINNFFSLSNLINTIGVDKLSKELSNAYDNVLEQGENKYTGGLLKVLKDLAEDSNLLLGSPINLYKLNAAGTAFEEITLDENNQPNQPTSCQ